MNKLISVNYWFGCDWWFYEVGYRGLHAGQLSLACAGVYLWNTGYLRVTSQRMNSGIQQKSNSICYHAVCEAVAMQEILTGHVKMDENPADLLTKVISGGIKRQNSI